MIRNMMKNKLYLFINVFGMAISIACCIVAYYNWDFNQNFDGHHAQAESIYRVSSIREFQNDRTKFGIVPIPLGGMVKQNIPDVEEVVRYSTGYADVRIKEEVFGQVVSYVDPSFFKVFSFEFVEGDTRGMEDKTRMYISDELATKFFGNTNAVGKPITHLLDSGRVKEYVVAGVYKKQPTNSSFNDDLITVYENAFQPQGEYNEHNWKFRNTLFVKISNADRIAAIQNQLRPYAENNNLVREDFIIREFEIEPFVGMAVRDSYNEVPATWTRGASPLAAVLGVGLMGIFVLLIACFNLTNTAIAISSRRLKEIGIRKVMGSMRKDLIIQFIGETMLVCFVSLLLGMVIAEFLLIPGFNELWPEMKLKTDYFGRPDFLFFMIGTLAFTGLLAGSYPAFYISRFQPTEILKGKLKFGGTNIFTRVLLTLQFAISLTAIVCSIAFTENAKYQQEFDLGFNKKGVAYTYINNASEYETFRNRLRQNPDVISTASSVHHFYQNYFNDPIKSGEKEIEVDIMDVDADYLKTVGLHLVEGRDFTKDSGTDLKESVIITQSVADRFGWDKAVGQEITWLDTVRYYVVGVIKDVYNRGLWDPKEPVMIRYADPTKASYIIASAPTDKLMALKADMETIYKDLFPERIANVRYMDEEIVEANTVNNNIVTMFIFLGIVAMMLSATGLFTLVSLNIIKKMKEIGVRKVLGASIGNITRVINTEFAIILSIASVAGAALGFFMAGSLMASIWNYYQDATPVTLIVSVLLLFVISALSIGYKVYSTARLNPSKVLRDE
jgi:putative ABC transport system permease protein